MAPEATPNDETAPLFVYERAMPAMGDRRFLMQCRQRKVPIAGMARSYTQGKKGVFTPTVMPPEATPNDETAPLFVYERAMPAMGDRRFLMQCRQRKVPIAGMARSYTGGKSACFTPTSMPPELTPNDETAPLFVYERAMPAMGDRRFLMQCRQRKVPVAGMARSYTPRGKKGRVHANCHAA